MRIWLSIIIPAYNVADFIKTCIETCEKQDIPYSSYEVIIINDGSTDETLQIISKLQEQYFNLRIINQENQGQSVARNKGCKLARGKYIWFVDSDDYISKNCLGTIINIMERNKVDALCVSSLNYANFRDDLLGYDIDPELSPVISGVNFILNNQPIIVAPWGYIFRLDFWQGNDFSFIPNIYYEDAQLLPIVISKCKRIMSFRDKVSCYCYNTRDGSTMNSFPNLWKIKGYALISDTHLKYSKELENISLRNYFEASASFYFIKGVNMIFRYNGGKTIKNDFFAEIAIRPKKIFARSLWEKFYQYIVLHYPIFYCKMRCLFNV